MVLVIGYEGRRQPNNPLSWGAAALREGDLVINAASQLGYPLSNEELSNMCALGFLTLFPWEDQLVLGPFDRADGPVVLEATRYAVDVLHLNAIIKREHVLNTPHGGPAEFFVFRSRSSFDDTRADVALRLCHRILSCVRDPVERAELIEMGLTLTAHHGGLNAMRAWYAKGDKNLAFSMAQASVRSEYEKDQFRQYYDTLYRTDQETR